MSRRKEISKEEVREGQRNLAEIRNNELTPTLQLLGLQGVKVKHFDHLRKDAERCSRVSRIIQMGGGWHTTYFEDECFYRFGENGFVLAEESCRVFTKIQPNLDKKEILYSRQELEWCTEENDKGEAEWRLVWINGITPHHLLYGNPESFDFDLRNPGSESIERIFHRWESETPTGAARGYRLVDFKPRWPNLPWDDQLDLTERVTRHHCVPMPAHWALESLIVCRALHDDRPAHFYQVPAPRSSDREVIILSSTEDKLSVAYSLPDQSHCGLMIMALPGPQL
jgi:hypothetical protein